jgi:hypothetical protein
VQLTAWRSAAIAAVSVGLVGVGALRPFPDGHVVGAADLPDNPVSRGLSHWDGAWYASIATDGYWYRPGEQGPVAFFPGYPLAVRGLVAAGLNRWVAASLLTLACGLIALALFRRWAQAVSPDSGAAALAPWLLALYPFAFYLYGVVYGDALFLTLAVGAFLCIERRQVGWASVLGALATATRPVAPAIVVGLLVRNLELRRAAGEKLRAADFVPVLAVAGMASYMVFLAWRFGDALAFAHVQAAPGWDQPPGWHTWLKVPWFEAMFPRVAPLVAVRLGGHALVTLIALGLVIPTWKRLGKGYGAYCFIALGLPALSSRDFQGLGRYVMAAFPVFLTLALLVSPHPRVRRAYLAATGALVALLAVGFGAGAYVS